MQRFLEPFDVAALAAKCGVPLTPARVRVLADAGKITLAGITARGSRLFTLEAVERFLTERGKRIRPARVEAAGEATCSQPQERSPSSRLQGPKGSRVHQGSNDA